MQESVTPDLPHEKEAKATMAEAVCSLFQEGQSTIQEADLARAGFTAREIADNGKAAIKAGRALYRRRRRTGKGLIQTYTPISRVHSGRPAS